MNNPGIIINIGRQVGSGGRTIAKMLANDFGCKFYDKEILNLAAKESGFCEKFFEQHDEQKGFAQSLFHFHIPMMGDNNFYQNNFSQESLFQFQSDAIRKAAAAGNCVFVGRTADYILRDFDNTIDIFITAKIEDRITYSQSRQRNIFMTKRANALLTIIIIQERNGEIAPAMTYASTPAFSESRKRRPSL